MIRNSIFTLSLVLLASLSAVSLANAQTPPYIETDKYLYHYGDDIQITAYLVENSTFFPDASMSIINQISGEPVMPNEIFPMVSPYIINHTHPTIIIDPHHEITFPSDGIYEVVITYWNVDITQVSVTTEILYVEFPFNVIDRFDGIDGTITTINGTLTTVQQDILDLQNSPAIPPDLLSRINVIESQILEFDQRLDSLELLSHNGTIQDTRITTLENLPSVDLTQIETRISQLEDNPTNLTPLETRVTTLEDNPTNLTPLENDITTLQTTITNNAGRIVTLENIPSVDLTPIETRITTLEDNPTDLTSVENNITALQSQQVPTNAELQTTITNHSGRITTLEDNPTTTDLTQIESQIQTLQDQQVPTNAELQISINNNNGKITTLENNIPTVDLTPIDARITQLENNPTDLVPLENRVTTLEQTNVDLTPLEGRVTTLENTPTVDLTPLQTDISNLRTDVDAIDASQFDETQRLRIDTLETTQTSLREADRDIESDIMSLQIANNTQSDQIDSLSSSTTDLFGTLDSKLRQIEQVTIPHISDGFNTIQTDVTGLRSDVNILKTVSSQDVAQNIRMDTIESDLNTINNDDLMLIRLDINSLYHNMDNPEGIFASISDLQTTETQTTQDIIFLKNAKNSNDNNIGSLQIDVTQLRTDVDAIEPSQIDGAQNLRLDTLEQTSSGFQQSITGLGDELDTLEQTVSEQGFTVLNWLTTINQNQADIRTITELVPGMQQTINWNYQMINRYLPVR